MHRRHIFIILGLVLLVSAFLALPRQARSPQQTAPVATESATTTPAAAAVKSAAPAALVSPAPATQTPPSSATPASPAPTQTAAETAAETATLVIEGRRYSFQVTDGITVADAMRNLSSTGLRYTAREYAGLGIFIESIDGKSGTKDEGWFLYVNDVSAPRGASQTIVEIGDIIEWRFKKSY